MRETAIPQNYKRPRAVDRILHSRGTHPVNTQQSFDIDADEETVRRPCFVESGGKPQMAFSIVLENGEMHGFQYFNIDNLKFTPTKSGDHLSFDHRGKVVALNGKGLKVIMNSILGQSLISIAEHSGCSHDKVFINRIKIVNL